MVLQVVNATNVGLGLRVDLGTADSLLVGRDGLIVATDANTAVQGFGSGQSVRVSGTVFGGINGVHLGSNGSVDSSAFILINSGGQTGGGNFGAVSQCRTSRIVNYGFIEGAHGGIGFDSSSTFYSLIENFGTIHGANYGIIQYATEAFHIVNHGQINGNVAIQCTDNADSVRNSGTINGAIILAGGADTYDGRDGVLNGTLFAGAGNDTFVVGAGVETIDGGLGNDLLDFRATAVIRLALDSSFANTGTATGDSFIDIENVYGSAFGNDVVQGNALANGFYGFGGADTLLGGAGNDQMVGGTGIDALTGGAGNDSFVFLTLADAGDIIADFGPGGTNDDRFLIKAAAFGGGLVAGPLAAGQFITRADNVAQQADDRFIFRTTDRTLWFDANGNAAGGLTMVADLHATATMTALDIVLI